MCAPPYEDFKSSNHIRRTLKQTTKLNLTTTTRRHFIRPTAVYNTIKGYAALNVLWWLLNIRWCVCVWVYTIWVLINGWDRVTYNQANKYKKFIAQYANGIRTDKFAIIRTIFAIALKLNNLFVWHKNQTNLKLPTFLVLRSVKLSYRHIDCAKIS